MLTSWFLWWLRVSHIMCTCWRDLVWMNSWKEWANIMKSWYIPHRWVNIHNVISARLFREHCVYFQGHYVKDMSLLNRPINECIIVDNSPMSYAFHPENAIGCGSYIDCPSDIEMRQIADFLENLSSASDVRGKTRLWRHWCSKNPSSVPK